MRYAAATAVSTYESTYEPTYDPYVREPRVQYRPEQEHPVEQLQDRDEGAHDRAVEERCNTKQCGREESGRQELVLEELSAQRLHEVLLRAHAAGNRARLAFIETLATLEETRLYLELGCRSIVVYGERCFGYRKSEICECLRVHEAIGLLRRAAEAFVTGRMSWSQLREITRVATRPGSPDSPGPGPA